jgi:hypothetical protein
MAYENGTDEQWQTWHRIQDKFAFMGGMQKRPQLYEELVDLGLKHDMWERQRDLEGYLEAACKLLRIDPNPVLNDKTRYIVGWRVRRADVSRWGWGEYEKVREEIDLMPNPFRRDHQRVLISRHDKSFPFGEMVSFAKTLPSLEGNLRGDLMDRHFGINSTTTIRLNAHDAMLFKMRFG